MMICHLETRMFDVFSCLVTFDSMISEQKGEAEGSLAVKYASYSVPQPFTAIRALIVECIVLMVESDEVVAGMIPVELWKLMLTWTTKYAHNNIYHSLFYRLIFAVLRQNQEPAQRILFQKAKFTTFLIDSFIPYPNLHEECSYKRKPDELVSKMACRGLILNCANAIRLQASCSPPTSFLRQFLNTHGRWKEFLPKLMAATDVQQRFGMGINVGEGRMNTYSSFMMMNVPDSRADEGGMDHGSRLAKSLGFYDDIAWPGDSLIMSNDEDDEDENGHIVGHYEEDVSDTESLPPAIADECAVSHTELTCSPLSGSCSSLDEGDVPHSIPPQMPTFDPPEVDEHVTWTAPEVSLEHRLAHSLQTPDIHSIQSPEERGRRASYNRPPAAVPTTADPVPTTAADPVPDTGAGIGASTALGVHGQRNKEGQMSLNAGEKATSVCVDDILLEGVSAPGLETPPESSNQDLGCGTVATPYFEDSKEDVEVVELATNVDTSAKGDSEAL
jgi:hypothetical protein